MRIALAKPPAPVVSWPITPNREGQRLVHEARGLAADAQLEQDEVRAIERGVAIAGQAQATRPVQPIEHPLGEAADDLEPVGVRVEQDELIDRQAVGPAHEAVDQLRRVGAAPADDRDLGAHPPLRAHGRLAGT